MNKTFVNPVLNKYLLDQIIVLYLKMSQISKLGRFSSDFIVITEEDCLFRIKKIKNIKKYIKVKTDRLYKPQPETQRKPIHDKYITRTWYARQSWF